jgi:hypothetical protein
MEPRYHLENLGKLGILNASGIRGAGSYFDFLKMHLLK